MQYEPQTFDLPTLDGISQKTMDEHLKLYEGYIKHYNLIHEIVENQENPEYARREAYRRLSFEFDGIRNHELFFSQFEGGATAPNPDSALYKKIVEWTGDFETFLRIFNNLTTTRGIGWAMLGYDSVTGRLIQYWVDEQHLGHLTGVTPILALDMWEHSYVMDFAPSGKKDYVEAFFKNLNWSVCEERLAKLVS